MRESFGLTSRLLWPALLGIGCVVHAQGPGSEMRLSLQRETKTPTRVANLRGGCSFIVNDLQGGSFEGPSYGRTDVAAVYFSDLRVGAGTTFNAPFFCTTEDAAEGSSAARHGANQFDLKLGAKRIGGKWVPVDLGAQTCDPRLFPKSQRKGIVLDAPCFYPNEHFKAFTFEGHNWQGLGTLLDMTTGEPRFRQRELAYCLIPNATGKVALCGHVYVRYLKDPKSDVLPRVMKILKSIEFVAPPAPPRLR